MEGPWSQALSEYAGRPIRLLRCAAQGGAIDVFPVTLVSTGSLRRLAREVGTPVDAARFRAGFVLDNASNTKRTAGRIASFASER